MNSSKTTTTSNAREFRLPFICDLRWSGFSDLAGYLLFGLLAIGMLGLEAKSWAGLEAETMLVQDDDDPFADPDDQDDDEEDDPFADPDDEDEEDDPFGEPDDQDEDEEDEDEEDEDDPFAGPEDEDEDDDPFGEPEDEQDEPVEEQDDEEGDDPFAEPGSGDDDPKADEDDESVAEPKEEEEPKADPKPVPALPEPEADPPTADPGEAPAAPKPEPDTSGNENPDPSNEKETPPANPFATGPANAQPSEAAPADTTPADRQPAAQPPAAQPPSSPAANVVPNPSSTPDPAAANADSSDSTPPGTDVAYERFMGMAQEMTANEQQINQMVINMPVGFPDKLRAHQAKIESLRQRNAQILQSLKPTAIESFTHFPNTQQAVTNYLLQDLQQHLTGKNYRRVPFNPVAAREAWQMMSDGGVDLPVFHMLGYRTHYLLNDFDAALDSLRKAAAAGFEVDPRMPMDLKQMTMDWNRELEFQQQDAANANPRVSIETDSGTMIVELFEDQVPNTVAHFITLVEDGFYNGLAFYQVNPTEVAVTGSPSNDGKGGPGYGIEMEIGGEDQRHHFTGVLSMLNTGQKTVSSKFLITKQPRRQFDGKIPAFGRVVEGLETLYKIKVINRTSALTVNDDTVPTRINRITVLRKRNHDYQPQRVSTEAAALSGGNP